MLFAIGGKIADDVSVNRKTIAPVFVG